MKTNNYFIIAGLLINTLNTQGATPKNTNFVTTNKVTKLNVKCDSGDIKVYRPSSRETSVKVIKTNWDNTNCDLTVKQKGDLLQIKSTKKKSGVSCEALFNIAVPSVIDTKINLGNGNLKSEGLIGKVNITAGNGNIEIEKNKAEIIKTTVGHGNIQMQGVFQKNHINVGAGNVEVSYNKKPTAGNLNIKIGTGNASASFPKDTNIIAKLKAAIGSTTNEFGVKKTKDEYYVSMKAGVGSVNITKN